MSQSDDQAWELLRQRLAVAPRDESVWRDFFRVTWPFVLTAAHRQLRGNLADAEDAAQQCLIRIVRSCPFAKLPNGAALRAYVFRAAVNMAHDFRRDVHSTVALDADNVSDPHSEPVDARLLREEFLAHGILDRLDDTDASIVRKLVAGRTLTEIAALTGQSYSSVGVRLHRLRNRLRDFSDHP